MLYIYLCITQISCILRPFVLDIFRELQILATCIAYMTALKLVAIHLNTSTKLVTPWR